MLTNRIQSRYAPKKQPAKGPSTSIPTGFVATPPFFAAPATQWQWQLYQAAYEQARRTAEVPRHYRRFFAAWN